MNHVKHNWNTTKRKFVQKISPKIPLINLSKLEIIILVCMILIIILFFRYTNQEIKKLEMEVSNFTQKRDSKDVDYLVEKIQKIITVMIEKK